MDCGLGYADRAELYYRGIGEGTASVVTGHGKKLLDSDRVTWVRVALEKLSENQHLVIEMACFEGPSQAGTATHGSGARHRPDLGANRVEGPARRDSERR